MFGGDCGCAEALATVGGYTGECWSGKREGGGGGRRLEGRGAALPAPCRMGRRPCGGAASKTVGKPWGRPCIPVSLEGSETLDDAPLSHCSPFDAAQVPVTDRIAV